MKKQYIAPTVDTVKFEYKDQIVAASGGCSTKWNWSGPTETSGCTVPTPDPTPLK